MILKLVKGGDYIYDSSNKIKTVTADIKNVSTKLRIETNKYTFLNENLMKNEATEMDVAVAENLIMNELKYLAGFAKLVIDDKPLTTDIKEMLNTEPESDFWLSQDIVELRKVLKSFREVETTGGYTS